MSMEAGSCSVRGALAFVLRVTAAAGVTPARLTPGPRGYVLRYSPARHVLSCLFYGLLCLFTVTYIFWNNAKTIMIDLRNGTAVQTAGFFFTIFVCATVVLDAAMVFKGAKHTKELIAMLNAVQKLNLVTKQQRKFDKMDKRRKYLIVVYIFFYLITSIKDMAAKMLRFELNDHVLVVSTLHHVGYLVMLMLAMRFIFIALLVLGSFQSLNLSLGELYSDIKRGRSTDCTPNKSLVIPEEIRRLATAYSALCDVVRELNRSYGASLLITLCFIVYLFGCIEFALVNVINVVFEDKDVTLAEVVDITHGIFWTIINVMNIILLTEPCHRTHNEMQITNTYVTQILQRAPHGGPVSNELEMFHRLTILDRPSYSPLKLCTMERSLALKMTAGIISYVVIVLQLDVQ